MFSLQRAKALAASSVSSVFTGHTPQSILRSSARTTPLASPSVSPGRSITPPLRPREAKISFMEQIDNKYIKGVLTPDKDLPASSPLTKSAQDTIWTERMTLSISNTSTKDLDEMDESSSGIQDGSPSKMEASREASNISARSDQTTLEYHDAPTPEDMEDDVVTVTAKSELLIFKDSLPSEVGTIAAPEIRVTEVQELQDKDTVDANTDHISLSENDTETLHQLTAVQEIVTQVKCASEEVEDNAQTVGMDPESVSSTQDSASVISIHDSEDVASAHSEHLNEENEVVELNGEVELHVLEDKSLVTEEYPVARSPLSCCLEEEDKDLKEKEASESELMTSCHQLHPAIEFQVYSNAEFIEEHYTCEHSDDRNSLETDDAEVENALAASNFTLILEEEGEGGEHEAAEGEAGENEAAETEVLESNHSSDKELKTLSKMSFTMTEEYAGQEIKITDTCPANAFTLVDGEHETKIMETLPYVPEPIKVAVEENLLDVFKGNSGKDFTSEVDHESAHENESLKKRRSVRTARTPAKKKETKSEDMGAESVIQAVTPQKRSDVAGLRESLETSPKEDLSAVANPQTPRRTVRKSARTESKSAELEVQHPVTPRRGRKAKENEEKLTLATSQEEQPSSQIFRRKRSQVPEKTQSTEVGLTSVDEVTVQLPLSPARTRRSKAPISDEVNKGNEDLLDPKVGVLTPPRITRSSKIIQEAETELLTKTSETDQVTTPTRGRRGKRAVNELVKHFELNAIQTNSSPPVSPKRVSLRWSRIKSENQIDHQAAEQENTQSQEQIVDTPRKRTKKSNVGKLAEESTEISKKPLLLEQADELALTKGTKKGNLSVRQTRKRALPSVSEESVEERLNVLHPVDSQHTAPNADQDDQIKSIRLTRTRLSNPSTFADPSTVTFAFTTPTPRRRKNAKVELVVPPISPESVQPPFAPQYIFSPPSLRSRRTTRNSTIVTEKEQDLKIPESHDKETEVPKEQILKRPRGRPPKHKGNKAGKSVGKATWSPPSVEIQLLSPPESPDVDSENTKSVSTETKALNQNQLRRTRRRIVSIPVTRRKIR
ncbi:unnamed protein product [Staurois parvus]|uniref:Uncharacterized protein n=1 Tax=Staurois parvus TaxID=386267 RepID=A0ABN9ALM2_9NEOB|nr:unnamed protein product [Staurois parvus]